MSNVNEATSFTSLGSPVLTGAGSVAVITSGGITFDLLFDAAATAAPASFRAGIEQAASLLSAAISDPITVNLNIDYSGTGGGAAAGPDSGVFESYSSIRADLINHATPGDTIFNTLPTGSSIQGQTSVAVWNAQLKLFGLLAPNSTTTDDGSATFATDIDPNLLVGVALHELTHALGRVPYGTQPDIFDLFRFTSTDTRYFHNGNTASPAYFSVDGGNTKLADYGQTSDPSDFLNTGVQGPNDPFNEFYTNNTPQQLTAVDLEQLDALGFHLTSSTSSQPDLVASTLSLGSTSIASGGSTSVSYTVQNIGNATAGASTSKVYLSTDSTITTSDTVLATVSDASLAGGGSTTDSTTISLAGVAAGTYWIGAIADANGQVSEGNENNNVTAATQITVTSSVTAVLVNDTGSSSSDKITSNPALTGSADPNAVVNFTLDGTTIADTATADSNGTWTYTPSDLTDGSHTIVASETGDGAVSLTFTLDTVAPTVAIANEVLSTSRRATVATLTGASSETGDTISVYDGSTLLGTTKSGINGAWSFTTGTVSNAIHTYTVTANDVAGNVGNGSNEAILGSSLADNLVGTSGNDTINGNAGNDTLTSGGGSDTLTGGAGIDTFNVNGGTATITDLGSGGADNLIVAAGATANARVAASWTATSATSNLGTVNLTDAGFSVNLSAANVSIAGSQGYTVSNAGSSKAVTLIGSGLADTLTGGNGADTLNGGGGNDVLTGGGGADKLTGGAGNNTFVYNAISDSTPRTHDTITDFTHGVDIISFTNIVGINASGGIPTFQGQITGTGNLTLNANSVAYIEVGSNTEILVNTTNSTEIVTSRSVAAANIEIVLTGLHLGLTASDFYHV